MKHNLDNISKKTDGVRLTSAEKLDMLSNLRKYAASNPVPMPSPYQSVWFRQMPMCATAFAFVIGSGFTSYAAEDSLPGDTLYGIKTNVNEGVIRILPLPTSAKAKVEITMIDRRMEELEKMIVTDIDTPEKVDVIMQQIEDHKDEFDMHLAVLTEDVRQEEVDVIHSELETVVDAHIDVLEEITSEEDLVQEPDSDPEPIAEPVTDDSGDVPATDMQGADTPVSNDLFATGLADEPASTTMTMKFMAIEPTVDMDGPDAMTSVSPMLVKKTNPIVEEVTDFSEKEVKPFTQRLRQMISTSTEIQEERAERRDRIFKNAERNLRIDIDEAVEQEGAETPNVGI